jgi:hypothetical protein
MTENQSALREALNDLYDEQGGAFAAGYMSVMMREMLALLPQKRQKEFLRQLQDYNEWQRTKSTASVSGLRSPA